MKVYFFGVIDPQNTGHFLYGVNGQKEYYEDKALPFRYQSLDGGLLPPASREKLGEFYLSIINGWTVLGMWDRSGDKRFGSSASFIAEGVHTEEEMKIISSQHFPKQWARIQRNSAPAGQEVQG